MAVWHRKGLAPRREESSEQRKERSEIPARKTGDWTGHRTRRSKTKRTRRRKKREETGDKSDERREMREERR